MFNFFNKSPKTETKASTSNYPAIVDEIHNAFNVAGERLLEEAKGIIANIRFNNKEKADTLKSFGFSNTKEVIETDKALEKKKQQEELANALEYHNINYPQYKFITKDMAMGICKKYNLVLGEVSQYTGFVPEKNIKQIAKFYENKNEINTEYSQRYSSMWSRAERISKKEYDDGIEYEKQMRADCIRYSVPRVTDKHFMENKVGLFIAAPLKDMKSEGYTLKDRIFTREIPDPVVLAPVKYQSIELYCIVTAWGDEASDEIVVNQQMN